VQHTIVQILLHKLELAATQTGIKQICIAGGVSANRGLREALVVLGEKKGWHTFIPDFNYCTDNAAMIAMTAYYKYLAADFAALDSSPSARASW
jgi:N6-L-threonylcarbamoyladenine synthase